MNTLTFCGLQRAFLCALIVGVGLVYTACSPVKPLLTRSEAKAKRTAEQEALIIKQTGLKTELKTGKITVDSAATMWAGYSRDYETRLSEIARLQQPPNTPLTTSSIVFDPFGAGTSGPRRVRYGRQLWVEAAGINPLKYDVMLASTPFSYTYEIPAAPSAAVAPKTEGLKADFRDSLFTPVLGADRPLPSFSIIEKRLANYDEITLQLERLYRMDAWPETETIAPLVKKAEELLSPTPVTATNFALYQREQKALLAIIVTNKQDSTATLKKAVDAIVAKKVAGKVGELTPAQKMAKEKARAEFTAASVNLVSVNELLERVATKVGGSSIAKQDSTFKRAEVLGQVLVALRQEPFSRSRLQVLAKGDEMDTKLTLTVRSDYSIPPGRAAGKLLEWQTTTQVTHRFRVSASAGAYLTGLQDHTYGLFNDSVRVRRRVDAASATDTTTRLGFKGARRIGRLNTQESINIGFTGLTHFHYRLLPAFDVAASVGLGAQTAGVQLLAGLTVLTGGEKQRLCLTGGAIGGRVTRLSGGYREGDKVPLTGISTVPTQSVNKTSWFFAITYNLTGARQ